MVQTTQMLNSAGYEVFHADTMTGEQALYCLNLARPRKRFKSWKALRAYFLAPLLAWNPWPEDHPFARLTLDQRDNDRGSTNRQCHRIRAREYQRGRSDLY
jgi:hypothetical protein